MAGYWRSGRGILSHEQREREDDEAARRLASIGATPAARGQPATLGPGYTRRGDLIFGTDVRKGDYIPKRQTQPPPELFHSIFTGLQNAPIYLQDLPYSICRFESWFRVYATHRSWRDPVWGQLADPHDTIYIAAYQASTLAKDLRECANMLESDICRLEDQVNHFEAQLPDDYHPPWTLDEETNVLWNNCTGRTYDCERPHYT